MAVTRETRRIIHKDTKAQFPSVGKVGVKYVQTDLDIGWWWDAETNAYVRPEQDVIDRVINLENVNVKQNILEEITAKGIAGTVKDYPPTVVDTTLWDSPTYNAKAKKVNTDDSYAGEDIFTSGGTHIKAIIDSSGNYTLSGTPNPALYPKYAIVYNRKSNAKEFGQAAIPSAQILTVVVNPGTTRDVANAEIKPSYLGDDWNFGTGGLRDFFVTIAIKFGDVLNTALSPLLGATSIIGGINANTIAQTDELNSGVVSWSGSGTYYTIVGSTFRLDRSGTGRINSKLISWTAPQTSDTLAVNACTYIYIDSDGLIQSTTNRDTAFSSSFPLFEALNDGTNIVVVKEDHIYSFQSEIATSWHETIGVILHSSSDSPIIGADITRVALGTGVSADDRRLKIVGEAELDDEGIGTIIPDSSGVGVVINWYYTNVSGNWVRQSQSSEAPMFWNDAGTITALGTGKFANHRIYVSKDDKNSALPVYFGVIGDVQYNSSVLAGLGIPPLVTNELWRIELAQLGLITVLNNASGGYISDVIIAKTTLGNVQVGGAASSTASATTTNTAPFDKLLSSAEVQVQVALETIDEYAVDKRGQSGGQIINGGLLTSETLSLYNNAIDNQGLTIDEDGNVIQNTPNFFLKNVNISGIFHTGVISNNIDISINVLDDTTFDYPAGFGIIVDKSNLLNIIITHISWDAQVGITADYLLTAAGAFVGVDSIGDTVQQVADFTDEQLLTISRIGRISHFGNTVVTDTYDFPFYYWVPWDYAMKLKYDGTSNISGNEFSANGANMKLDKAAGLSARLGANDNIDPNNPNMITISSIIGIPFLPAYRNGSGRTTPEIPPTTDLNNLALFYDNGSGTKQTLGNNRYTIVSLVYFPSATNLGAERVTLFAVYGQEEFLNYTTAESAATSGTYNPVIEDDISGGNLAAFIILEKGETNLESAIASGNARIINQPSATIASGGGTATPTFQSVYNVSAPPQIITDAIHNGFQIQGGTGIDSDNLQIWKNNAGSNVGNLTGEGNLNLSGKVNLPDGYIGAGRNGDFSTVSNKSASWHRIGANGALAFFPNGSADTGDTPFMFLTENGGLGLGTTTVPHAGVGAAKSAIDGANASLLGPHIQYTTIIDNFPLFQQLNWTHDDIALSFDAYYDGVYKSSDDGSSFQFAKLGDIFSLNYDVVTKGNPISWNIGLSLDINGNVNVPNGNVINAIAPTLGTHLTNKDYVDGLIQNVKRKDNCVIATTGNITLSGEQTIDGVLTSSSRVLVWQQSDQTENGIYISNSGAWTRSTDADTGTEILGALVKIIQGSSYGGHGFNNSNSSSPTLGVDNITFVNMGDMVIHSQLLQLQGGTTDEYYHLTSAKYTQLNGITASFGAINTIDDGVANQVAYSNGASGLQYSSGFIFSGGNLSVSGWVRGDAPGQILNTVMVNVTGDTVAVNGTSYITVATTSYTTLSDSSYLKVEFNTRYDIDGTGSDDFLSQLTVDSSEITYAHQQFIDGSGGGTRGGVLFPLMGRYTNSSISSKTINANARRNSSDNDITSYKDGSTWFTITEIAR